VIVYRRKSRGAATTATAVNATIRVAATVMTTFVASSSSVSTKVENNGTRVAESTPPSSRS
jgi:hypothetical protein